MSQQLLTLIHDERIQPTPGTKILPADTFSSLLEANEMLAKVKEDADQYRREVVEELEKEKDAARQEGFAAGMKLWVEQIKLLEDEIGTVHAELRKLVGPLAIKAAQKIVGRELETSEETIVDIIANSLRAVSQHQVINIYVHPSQTDLLEKHRARLREVFDRLESLTVHQRDDLEPGGCVIETDAGIINVEMEHQWNRMAQAIEAMMKEGGKNA